MDREELKRLTKEEISRRIREGVKAVIEQVLEEEMTEHLAAGYRERTPSRRGERNGHYTRDLITPAGRIAQLRVPRDREGTFLTEVFERYKRMTGEVEEAVLEMYLQGVSTRKVAAITEGLSRVRIGKDAVSRVAQRLEEELSAWRGRPLELAYPYLYLDAAYFKVNWGGRVVDLALLVAVGVNEEGYREVLVVEPAGGERKEAWRNLLKGLVERGLRGVRLVISDDHPSIRQAVMAELPGASWQRCVVHFMRNVLAHVPQSERGVVAEELQEVLWRGGGARRNLWPGGSLSVTGTGLIPFYAESLVLGHQWNRVCRLRVSGAFSRTRHRSATTSIISSRSRKYRLATASFTKGHTRSTGWSSGE
jgi:putative transposase